MAVAGQGRPWHPWDAVVASRAALTVAEGLGARFHQAVSPRGAARTRGWRVAAGAWALTDVAKATWLARDSRFAFGRRMLLDAADLAMWCLAAGDDSDTSEDAVIPGVALAAEAGARWGAAGLVVPAANAAVAATVRARRGHRLRLEQFSWQLMGVIGGWSLALLAGRRRRHLEQRLALERQARLRRAELTGFHDLIVEHEGAVDVLQRATALVELSAPAGPPRSFVGAVKAEAARAARSEATYLADALAAWQRRHNLRPDLSGLVQLGLPAGAGLVLLSESQVGALFAALDDLSPAGAVEVELVGRDPGGRAFSPCHLRVGGQEVMLAGEGAPPRWVFDATPVAFLMDLGWLAQPVGAQREAVPWSATAGPLAATVGAALWSARRVDANRGISPLRSVAVSGAITLVYTVGATRGMRHPHNDGGISRFPWVMALQGYELVRGIPSEDSTALARAVGLVGTAVVVATGWHLSPPPRSARALVAELGWVVAFDVYTRSLRRTTIRSAEQLVGDLEAHDRTLEADAYRRGQQRAHRLIGQALEAARADLETRRPNLDADVSAEASRRLDTVAAVLTDVHLRITAGPLRDR